MPDVYRYEWTCPRTGTAYRLDFLDHQIGLASYGDVGQTVEPLNDDCIAEIKDFVWEADKRPHGMVSPPRLKVTFRAGRMPSTLIGWLRTSTGNTAVINAPTIPLIPVYIERGMTCVLWENGTAVWAGIIDLGQELLPDLTTGELTVEFVDAIQASLKALTWDAIKDADIQWARPIKSEDVGTRAAIEAVWQTDDDRWAYIGNVAPNNERNGEPASRFWFVPTDGLYNRWEQYAQKMIEAMTRIPVSITMPLFEMRGEFRKQNYQPDGGVGAALTESQVFRLFGVASSLDDNAELQYTWHDELRDKYSSFWDYLVDYCDECNKIAAFRLNGTAVTLEYYGPLTSRANTAVTLLDIDVRDVKVSLRSKALRIATASTEFSVNEDYDKQERTNQGGGRNDNSDTVVVVTRSSPVIAKYIFANLDGRHGQSRGIEWEAIPAAYWYDGPFAADPRSGSAVAYGYWPRFGGYYYRDLPTAAYDAFIGHAMIRCHSWNGTDGSTAPVTGVPLPTVPMPNVGGLASTATAWSIAEQQTYGALAEAATALLDTFSDANSSELSVTIAVDALAWRPLSHRYSLALDGITPYGNWMDGAPGDWWPFKCTADLKEGLMEVTAYGK